MKKRFKLILLLCFVALFANLGISYAGDIHVQETILTDFTFSQDQYTYDYVSIVDFYYGKPHPDSSLGGIHIGTNPHWPDSLFWSHTLPGNLDVPPNVIIRAKLCIDAKAVNTDQNTVEIQGTYNWDPLNHISPDNTIYDLTAVEQVGFWNQGTLNVIVRAGESQIRIDEAKLLIDYDNPTTDVGEDELASRTEAFQLSQNYPNPFNPGTQISFDLHKTTKVSLLVYNVFGQKVRTLIDTDLPTGRYTVSWDGKNDEGTNVSSGVYFCRLLAGDKMSTKKMTLMK